ncbi:MAG: T9SS type A sorting domain-containing protein [Bacteroidota bacterium]|nr:MAG: T9SS type A sorting domain-containing protein [Bacteroidota bacterium]
MSAYPSPFNASFTIDYQSDNDGEVDIVLTDMAGRKVLSQTRMVKEGSNQITITGLQGLAAGQYSVRIKDFNTDAEFVLKVENNSLFVNKFSGSHPTSDGFLLFRRPFLVS